MAMSDQNTLKDNTTTASRRNDAPKSTFVSATISDAMTDIKLPCIIREVDSQGCKIKIDQLDELGDDITIIPQGFSASLCGRIVWRKGNQAGIKFAQPKPNPKNPWLYAVNFLKNNTRRAYPRFYELWYTYVERSNPDLTRAVDQELKIHGTLSEEIQNRIYDDYLCSSRAAKQVDEVSLQIAGEFKQLESVLETSMDRTRDYEQSLESAVWQLDEADTREKVQLVATDLISATKDMHARASELESMLSNSREQINILNQTLDAVRAESTTDALTNIANRKKFDEELELAIAQATETQEPLTLIFGDIDHFKSFNDTHGHQTGDTVLKLVAQSLNSSVKGRDLPARYGGEEFAVIMPQTDLRDAMVVANQIRKSIMTKKLEKRSTGETLGSITMSFGVASFRHGEDAISFFERADAALYEAKRCGRNQVKSEAEVAEAEVDPVAQSM